MRLDEVRLFWPAHVRRSAQWRLFDHVNQDFGHGACSHGPHAHAWHVRHAVATRPEEHLHWKLVELRGAHDCGWDWSAERDLLLSQLCGVVHVLGRPLDSSNGQGYDVRDVPRGAYGLESTRHLREEASCVASVALTRVRDIEDCVHACQGGVQSLSAAHVYATRAAQDDDLMAATQGRVDGIPTHQSGSTCYRNAHGRNRRSGWLDDATRVLDARASIEGRVDHILAQAAHALAR
jgi:hypothetical protein